MKLHEKLFQIFVFLLPTQLAYHFWPTWSFIFGIRIDYLSPTVYLTQLVLLLMLALFLFEEKLQVLTKNLWKKIATVCLFLVLLLLTSSNPFITLSRFPLFLSVLSLFFYLRKTKDRSLKLVVTPFLLSLAATSLLALYQFFSSHSFGGLLYWFGERPLSVSTPGIALVSLLGVDYLRSYATFPHPNALSGSTLIFLVGLLPFLSSKQKLLAFVASFVVFIVTFSQTVWIVLLLLPFLFFVSRSVSRKLLFLVVPLMVIFSVVVGFVPPSGALSLPREIAERVILSRAALVSWAQYPLFGVGLGNGIVFSPRTIIQPVHNVFLLVAQELGLVGLLAFSLISIKGILTQSSQYVVLLLIFLVIGLFDHYFMTLFQPLLICTLVAGLIYSSPSSERAR